MKSDPKLYWFKRRRYGWGWTPVTWQGWLTVALFVITVAIAVLQLPRKPQPPSWEQTVIFWALFLGAILGLLAVSFTKGPAPRWRWGSKPTDDPDEDL